jgi:hypothetical protein
MADSINASGHPADNDETSRGKVTAQALRHLRSTERRAARPHDAEARQIQDLLIAAHVQQNRWIANLQQCLGIVRFRPIQQGTACNLSNAVQLFCSALRITELLSRNSSERRTWPLTEEPSAPAAWVLLRRHERSQSRSPSACLLATPLHVRATENSNRSKPMLHTPQRRWRRVKIWPRS